MDLTGIDVNYPVSRIIYDGYMQDPRIKTSPNHAAMFDAGLYGRKAGKGWFGYEGGKPLDRPSADFEPDAEPARKVALASADATALDVFAALTNEFDIDADMDELASELPGDGPLLALCEEIGLEIVEDDGACPIIGAPTEADASSFAVDVGVDAERLVCIDLMGDTSKRVTLMTPPGADPAYRQGIAAAIAASGRNVTLISDSPGFVGPRMVAMVGNLGCYMAEIGLASPEDINTAMELGLNYPRGSIALAEALGAQTCLELLESLQAITGEDRYRPTMWLRRRAMLGLSLHVPN